MIPHGKWRKTGRMLIIGVLLWKTITLLFAAIATYLIPLQLAYTIWRDPQYKNFGFYLPYLVSIWGNFDGFFYLAIARDGYLAGQQPFFPLYPVLIRGTTLLTGFPYVLSAQIISIVSLVGALIAIIKLLAVDRKIHLFPLVIAAILTFPTSYSYGAAYNDALFFFLATLTLYLGRTRHFGWAGVTGGLATVTRLNGLALFPYLIIEYLLSASDGWSWKETVTTLRHHLQYVRKTATHIWAIFLIPMAFILYAYWVGRQFGQWQTLFRAMSVWGQDKVTIPIQVMWRYVKILLYHPLSSVSYWVAVVELGSVVFYLWVIIWSIKKIRISYWAFLVLSILIPSLTGTFQGMPRYGLHLYPLFLILAMFLAPRTKMQKTCYFLVMIATLFFCILLFTRGYFIA